MTTLLEVLTSLKYQNYNDKLLNDGWSLDELLDLETKEEIDEVLKECGLKPGHIRRLGKKLWNMKPGNSNANDVKVPNNVNLNSNNNTSKEILQMKQQMQQLKLQYEMEKQKREIEQLKREEEERKRKEEEDKRKKQEMEIKQRFNDNFDFGEFDDMVKNQENDNNNESLRFPITLQDGTNNAVLYGFEKSDTVKTIFRRYAKKKYQSDSDNLLQRFTLTWSSKPLTKDDFNKSLESIGMGSKPHLGEFIDVIWVVDGGSRKVRQIKKNKDVNIVKGECCILKSEEECAKMICGHLISSYAMFYYIKTTIEKNINGYKMYCPVKKCHKVWDWDICCLVSDLSQEEYIGYTSIIRHREKISTGAFRTCPFCKVLIKRPEEIGKNRVKCSACNNPDFCFICAKKWNAGGFALCGNEDCVLYEKQKKLLNCKKIEQDDEHEYDYYKELDIPMYRACPRCYRFIEHKSACKHMNCPGCELEFCFICLGIYDEKNDKWPCMLENKNTDHSLGCSLAERQKLG